MVLGMVSTAYAADGTITNIGGANKGSIEKVGKVPVKKKIVLDLGGLRTVEAQLPKKPLSYEERMALRIKRAAAEKK